MAEASLPAPELSDELARWLAPARGRLLRRLQIARRRRVLDVACGTGAVTAELVRRSGGTVVALDRRFSALGGTPADRFAGAVRVCGDALRLPFADGTFDLVFCQFAMLWLDVQAVIGQVSRILAPGGALVAIEPDYGGLIEYPPQIATRSLWLDALRRSGADPEVGRKLPGLLQTAGFAVRVDLLDRLEPPSATRFRFLEELSLGARERRRLEAIRAADARLGGSFRVVHLPLFLITAIAEA